MIKNVARLIKEEDTTKQFKSKWIKIMHWIFPCTFSEIEREQEDC